MIEDSIGTALKGFTDASPVLGGVVIFLLLAIVWQSRFYGAIITELKDDLSTERADHQKTRAAQIEDIRNLGHVATSVDGLRNSISEMHTTIRDVLVRKA
jgi:hypothetical protein